MEERLQKLIARSGAASRRKAELLITEGRVKVNGIIVSELGAKASPDNEISIDDVPISLEKHVYLLMNKPLGTLCTCRDDRGRKTVIDCIPEIKERVFPVGRLDYDTSGVLILTNDGEFANMLMHPRYHLSKTYDVTVRGRFTEDMAEELKQGIQLEDCMTLPAGVSIQPSRDNTKSHVLITIFEGRNREVRRMMEYFNLEVIRLERIKYGFLTSDRLKRGQVRYLKEEEIEKLKTLSQSQPMSIPAADNESGSGSM